MLSHNILRGQCPPPQTWSIQVLSKEHLASAVPAHLLAVVLMREIKEQGYDGGISRFHYVVKEDSTPHLSWTEKYAA